jgi:hypothetical protein
MKTTILAAALALALPLAFPLEGQAQEQKSAEAKPADMAKPAPKSRSGKAGKVSSRKATAKRHQDARHCLQQPNNDAIIRCAEEYL